MEVGRRSVERGACPEKYKNNGMNRRSSEGALPDLWYWESLTLWVCHFLIRTNYSPALKLCGKF